MKNKLNWLEAVLVIAPFLVLAVSWNELPARVPIHWALGDRVDAWAPKTTGLLSTPLTALGVVVLLRILPWFDPKLRRNPHQNSRMLTVLQIIRLAIAALLGTMFWLQLGVASDHALPVGRVVASSTLVFLAIMGNYLGNLRPNYFAGIRTPWTLESPATWRATHRLGGRLMFFGSVALLFLQFFISEHAFVFLLVTSAVALALWGFLYSWHHFRTHGETY